MESANRNLESFAYSVSHDLKASLRGISRYSRLLSDDYAERLPDRVELVTEIEPGVLECDREGLSQILRNFVANAIKFSRASEPPRIRIEGRTTAAGYCFSVTDNGMGFDMRYHTRIFEIFQRLSNNNDQSGSGIGLALAACAAERMGGRVWAESTPGHGATFFVELTGRILI